MLSLCDSLLDHQQLPLFFNNRFLSWRLFLFSNSFALTLGSFGFSKSCLSTTAVFKYLIADDLQHWSVDRLLKWAKREASATMRWKISLTKLFMMLTWLSMRFQCRGELASTICRCRLRKIPYTCAYASCNHLKWSFESFRPCLLLFHVFLTVPRSLTLALMLLAILWDVFVSSSLCCFSTCFWRWDFDVLRLMHRT